MLAPWFAVAGLLAAAGVLVIHFLNRRRYKVVYWAAMDFLREAIFRNRRLLQLRDLLLLGLRMACLILFGLALARPGCRSAGRPDPNMPVHAVVLVDNSLSMAYREFMEQEIKPYVVDAFHEENPLDLKEIAPKMAKLGIIGAFIPREYGAAGTNYVTYGLICQEVGRVDSSLRSFIAVESALVMYPILQFGSEEQKRRRLPSIAIDSISPTKEKSTMRVLETKPTSKLLANMPSPFCSSLPTIIKSPPIIWTILERPSRRRWR